MRIDKFISELGVASRKEAASLAKKGAVTVNGVAVKDLSKHIDPNKDKVVFLGRELTYERFVWIMLNKPEGYVSATEDTKLPPVTDLLSAELRARGLFPVGRLDKDTLGLMILTNDGERAHRLLSPKRHVSKKYRFLAAEPIPSGAEKLFSEGVTLKDGYECKPAILDCDEDRLGGVITLTEGKYHQIKRMIASLGNKVVYLERIEFAEIPLDKSLARGESRPLTEDELAKLLSAADL